MNERSFAGKDQWVQSTRGRQKDVEFRREEGRKGLGGWNQEEILHGMGKWEVRVPLTLEDCCESPRDVFALPDECSALQECNDMMDGGREESRLQVGPRPDKKDGGGGERRKTVY